MFWKKDTIINQLWEDYKVTTDDMSSILSTALGFHEEPEMERQEDYGNEHYEREI